MKNVSVILKNNNIITIEEFRILDSYSYSSKIWILIQKPTSESPFVIRQRTVEYVFDPEFLTAFKIISQNVLAWWDTEKTVNLKPYEEYNIKDSLYIRPYLYLDS